MLRAVLLPAFIFLVAGSVRLHAQSAQRDAIRKSAQTMNADVFAGRYEKVIDAMYPRIVEATGGRDQMVKTLKNGLSQMERDGFKMESEDIGQAGEPVAAGGKLFSIVPQTTHIRGPNIMLEQPGFLLAISTDQGKTWTFLDGAGLKPEVMKTLFPDFPSTLKLPEIQPPKVNPLP